jgi:hypothetical protein
MKRFRPIGWRDSSLLPESAGKYVAHMLRELGRLSLEVRDIESRERPPHTKTVLSDLLTWLTEHPGKAFAELVDWKTLDLAQLWARLEHNPLAKPRIEVSANITLMNNLSVRWHPGGWRHTIIDWQRSDHHDFNLITHRRWQEAPDFRWFEGDEDPTFDSRPSNELMFIRGVGNLRPEPEDDYGPYATFNDDVVDSILICAVRSAYEGLIRQLQNSFEVEVVDAFEFVTRDEIDESDPSSHRFPIHRVIAWSLEDAVEVRKRREQKAAAEQEERDRAALANVATTHGFELDVFVAAVLRAASKKPTGPAPSAENINRNAAKELRSAGFKIDAGGVRRIRQLIERYNPEILPEVLRPQTVPAPPAVSLPSNIVPFPEGDK